MTLGFPRFSSSNKFHFLSFAILAMFSTHAVAQEPSNRRAHIDLARAVSSVGDQDMIARACTKTAVAAISAHAAGQLSTVLNEAAKAQKLGSSDNRFFNDLVNTYRLDTSDEFLFTSLFHAQLNLMWLEQLSGTYSSEKEQMFSSYLAARCGSIAEIRPAA